MNTFILASWRMPRCRKVLHTASPLVAVIVLFSLMVSATEVQSKPCMGSGATTHRPCAVASATQAATTSTSQDELIALTQDDESNPGPAISLGQAGSAIGSNAFVAAPGGTALGSSTNAIGQFATAVGYGAVAKGINAFAGGMSAEAGGTSSVAIGGTAIDLDSAGAPIPDPRTGTDLGNTYAYDRAVALGASARSTGTGAVSIGYAALAQDDNTIAIGVGAYAKSAKSVAIGTDTQAVGGQSVVIGGTSEPDPHGIGGGVPARSQGFGGTIIGNGATGWDGYATALGWLAGTFGESTTAVGALSYAPRWGATAVGQAAAAGGSSGVAVGFRSLASGNFSVAIGGQYALDANGQAPTGHDGDVPSTISPDHQTNALGDRSIALGSNTLAQGDGSMALGFGAQATGADGIATGENAVAASDYSIAVGRQASAQAVDSVAIGSSAMTLPDATRAVALGARSVADRSDAVSIGDTGSERQLIHLAAGTEATDAINKGQFDNAISALSAGTDGRIVTLSGNLGGVLGGGISLLGTFVPPTYTIQGVAYINVGSAFAAIDNSLTHLTGIQSGFGNVPVGTGNGVAVGSGSRAKDGNDVAVGPNANVGATNSVAVGADAAVAAAASSGTAAGAGAQVTVSNATALGAQSTATAANSVALGAGSMADQANTISVGTTQAQRRITNVASGLAATDAANLGQVNAAVATAQQYTDQRFNQSVDRSSFDTFRTQTDQRFNNVSQRLNQMGAMSAASTQMAINAGGTTSSTGRVAVGVGSQSNERALSVGYAKTLGDKARMSVGAAFGRSAQSLGVGLGVDL